MKIYVKETDLEDRFVLRRVKFLAHYLPWKSGKHENLVSGMESWTLLIRNRSCYCFLGLLVTSGLHFVVHRVARYIASILTYCVGSGMCCNRIVQRYAEHCSTSSAAT
jgi:hypothetical protein